MLFTDSHEWVKVDGDKARVGITEVFSKELETIENICLPNVNQAIQKGQEIVILESTKAASDSYAPISGTVLAINPTIINQPSSIHEDPQGAGWLYEMSIDDFDQLKSLVSEADYLDSINVSF